MSKQTDKLSKDFPIPPALARSDPSGLRAYMYGPKLLHGSPAAAVSGRAWAHIADDGKRDELKEAAHLARMLHDDSDNAVYSAFARAPALGLSALNTRGGLFGLSAAHFEHCPESWTPADLERGESELDADVPGLAQARLRALSGLPRGPAYALDGLPDTPGFTGADPLVLNTAVLAVLFGVPMGAVAAVAENRARIKEMGEAGALSMGGKIARGLRTTLGITAAITTTRCASYTISQARGSHGTMLDDFLGGACVGGLGVMATRVPAVARVAGVVGRRIPIARWAIVGGGVAMFVSGPLFQYF